MKHNHMSGLNIVIFIAAVPLLIFMCAAISLVSYLAFSNLDAVVGRTARDSDPVRIRTIPDLASVSPAPVTDEPELHLAGVIEDSDPEPVAHTEAPPVAEAPAEPVVSAPAAPTGPLPAEEPRIVPETILTQHETPVPAAEEDEAPPPVEDLPLVEVPAEPDTAEPTPPEVAARPEPPPQKEPPAPAAPSEPTFVPDSSFFDQLLDQVD